MAVLGKIYKHLLAVDKKMARLFADCKIGLLPHDIGHKLYFSKLCREIIGQQLSGKVASVIFQRFNSLFPGTNPTPDKVLEISEQKLRDTGMAWSKVRAIKDLAHSTALGELDFENYPKMKDEEIVSSLLTVKGIGPWTAEMFLIFTLGREDVFSIKDLGLQKAVCNIFKLDRKAKSTENKILKISKIWSPYRSYASLALWKSLDLEGWWR